MGVETGGPGSGRGGRRSRGVPGRSPPAPRVQRRSPDDHLAVPIGKDGRSEAMGEVIRRDDELAFAYRTDGSVQRVLVFARDELGRIYWYHPAWSDPTENPEAVSMVAVAGVHELPAAVAH